MAMTMPSSTPKSTTPAVATSESTSDDLRTVEVPAERAEVDQRERGRDHDGGERGLRAGRRAAS